MKQIFLAADLKPIVFAFAWAWGYHTPEGSDPENFDLYQTAMGHQTGRYLWRPEHDPDGIGDYWEDKVRLLSVTHGDDGLEVEHFAITSDTWRAIRDYVLHMPAIEHSFNHDDPFQPIYGEIAPYISDGRYARKRLYQVGR